MPKILSTVAGRSSAAVVIRRIMWGCHRGSSFGAAGMGLLSRLLPSMVYRWFVRIVFLRVARKRWRSIAVCGRTWKFSRLKGGWAVGCTGGLRNAGRARVRCQLTRYPVCPSGIESNQRVVEFDVSEVVVEMYWE